MISQASSCSSNSNMPPEKPTMGVLTEEIVAIQSGKNLVDPYVITINCPDRLGLACDLARIILDFNLNIVRGDFSTDGRWCLLLFWVVPCKMGSHARSTRWALLKQRLISTCPSCQAPLLQLLIPHLHHETEIYRLQTDSADRPGLLNDMTQMLWEIQLDIHKLNVTTNPDGRAINLFYISDARNSLRHKRRQQDVCNRVRTVLGDSCYLCELQIASPFCEASRDGFVPDSSLPPDVAKQLLGERSTEEEASSLCSSSCNKNCSVDIDNTLSPGHTLLQIAFRDRRGVLYDCTRTLKDLNMQVAYGRLSTTPDGNGDLDLFILQSDGSKLRDANKQKALLERLKVDLCDPIRLMVVDRGPDTELLAATVVESSGKDRPRVFYDITLVLKMMGICIFKADIGKLPCGERLWEVYRFLLADQPGSSTLKIGSTRRHIIERLRTVLMS